jgi:hypothetical protein
MTHKVKQLGKPFPSRTQGLSSWQALFSTSSSAAVITTTVATLVK